MSANPTPVAPPAEIVLETPRLWMRRLTDEDFVRLHDFAQDEEFHRFLGGPPAPLDEFLALNVSRTDDHYRTRGYGQWALVRKDDGAFVGRCGLILQEVDGAEEVEVGYAIGRPYWGHGYATESARASRDWGFRNLPADHVISIIDPRNARSIAVAERNGMRAWKETVWRDIDVRIYRIDSAEWEALGAG